MVEDWTVVSASVRVPWPETAFLNPSEALAYVAVVVGPRVRSGAT
jgi:hypothetical protein